jgi:ketosteroid isomerase-like protein
MGDNVEQVRGLYEAFNRPDVDDFVARLDPDVLWYTFDFTLGPRLYRGRDEVHVFVEELVGGVNRFRVEPERLVAQDDRVFARVQLKGSNPAGAETAYPLAHVWTLRDGLISKHRMYLDYLRAERALRTVVQGAS